MLGALMMGRCKFYCLFCFFFVFLYCVKCPEDCVCAILFSYLCNCSDFFMPAWPPPASECFCWRLEPPDFRHPSWSDRNPPPAASSATRFWCLLWQTLLTFTAATINKQLTLNAAWFKSTPSTTLEMIVFDWKWDVLEEVCWLICVHSCLRNKHLQELLSGCLWSSLVFSLQPWNLLCREPGDRQTENQAPIQ